MRPLAIRPGDKVLELGCGCGAITRFLGELGADVTAVESSLQRASIASERCRDLQNVKIVLDDLLDFLERQAAAFFEFVDILNYNICPFFFELSYRFQRLRAASINTAKGNFEMRFFFYSSYH